jgi:hypothetical protein
MVDPGCDFKPSEDTEACGKIPTEVLAIGMTGRDPGIPGSGGRLVFGHYCAEHLPIVQRKFRQRPD